MISSVITLLDPSEQTRLYGESESYFSPICWLVIAWIIPTGMVYTNAGDEAISNYGRVYLGGTDR